MAAQILRPGQPTGGMVQEMWTVTTGDGQKRTLPALQVIGMKIEETTQGLVALHDKVDALYEILGELHNDMRLRQLGDDAPQIPDDPDEAEVAELEGIVRPSLAVVADDSSDDQTTMEFQEV